MAFCFPGSLLRANFKKIILCVVQSGTVMNNSARTFETELKYKTFRGCFSLFDLVFYIPMCDGCKTKIHQLRIQKFWKGKGAEGMQSISPVVLYLNCMHIMNYTRFIRDKTTYLKNSDVPFSSFESATDIHFHYKRPLTGVQVRELWLFMRAPWRRTLIGRESPREQHATGTNCLPILPQSRAPDNRPVASARRRMCLTTNVSTRQGIYRFVHFSSRRHYGGISLRDRNKCHYRYNTIIIVHYSI